MAKMFYSLEEAAKKLNISTVEMLKMTQKGLVTEFLDGDRNIYKVSQIYLLAESFEDPYSKDSLTSIYGTTGFVANEILRIPVIEAAKSEDISIDVVKQHSFWQYLKFAILLIFLVAPANILFIIFMVIYRTLDESKYPKWGRCFNEWAFNLADSQCPDYL